MSLLQQTCDHIEPLDADVMGKARHLIDNLSKPLDTLGELEALACQVSGIRRQTHVVLHKPCIVVMCADNGVVAEGVSASPQEVTARVTRNFLRGITGVNVFARFAGATLRVVDIGVASDVDAPGLVKRKVRKGTANMAQGPAMSREEAIHAVEVGIEEANHAMDEGCQMLGTGEMGVGNTTTSAAVLCALGGFRAAEVTGRGAGATDEGLARKIAVIEKCLARNQPQQHDPLDVLSKVGGLDLAGLSGVCLAGAARRVPVVLDGFISGVAALTAMRICPSVRDYLIPSHFSAEAGTVKLLDLLRMTAYLRLGMHLGEGTGAALGFTLVDLATRLVREMGTLDDAGFDIYVPRTDGEG